MSHRRTVARVLAGALLASSIALVGAMPASAGVLELEESALIGPAPPGGVKVDVVTVNGSGCPAGTAKVTVAPDNTAFTVTYSDYTAAAGARTEPTDFRKNCQLVLRISAPSGFTYAIARADYRGYAYLAPGATGIQRANYYFQGQSETATVSRVFSGPMDADWQTTHRVDIASLVFKPCGADVNLNVNSSLRVNTGTSDPATTSVMTMDSTDGSVSTVYHFAWQTCG